LAVGIQLLGYGEYLIGLLQRRGIKMTQGTRRFLDVVANAKERHQSLLATGEYKRKRAEKTQERLCQLIQEAERMRRKKGFYTPGEGFNTCIPVDMSNRCAACGSTQHKSKQSKKCSQSLIALRKEAEERYKLQQKKVSDRLRELEETDNNNSV
jgi:hypothetical protein